jgi:hypothetical protein
MNNALKGLFATGVMMSSLSAHAALTSVDGGLGVYDSTNNVTWASNANLFASQYSNVSTIVTDANSANGGAGLASGMVFAGNFSSTGQMTWAAANAWVYYLDVTNYGNSTHWALPTTVDSASSIGFPDGAAGHPSQSSSQMAQLFYGGLGQVAVFSITTTNNGAAGYNLFSNVQNGLYWSGTQLSAVPASAWIFSAHNGGQNGNSKSFEEYALAVSPGQVSAVPLPGAAWLLGSGLLGLLGLGRRRRTETFSRIAAPDEHGHSALGCSARVRNARDRSCSDVSRGTKSCWPRRAPAGPIPEVRPIQLLGRKQSLETGDTLPAT